MAIFIFGKNSDDVTGALVGIASTQTVYDANKNWVDNLYDLVTVTNADYTAVKLGTKKVVSKTGTTVTYDNEGTTFNTPESLILYIQNVIDIINNWLVNNSSKSLASTVTTYKNYIESLDVTTLNITEDTPLDKSLEAYVEDQGTTAIHPLELL